MHYINSKTHENLPPLPPTHPHTHPPTHTPTHPPTHTPTHPQHTFDLGATLELFMLVYLSALISEYINHSGQRSISESRVYLTKLLTLHANGKPLLKRSSTHPHSSPVLQLFKWPARVPGQCFRDSNSSYPGWV